MALILLAFSSCTSYQYLTLDSPEVQKNDKKEFSWQNDTLRLTYNFHGEGGPVSLTVFNKTDKPLYVNWKKSALIRDSQAISLFNSNVQIGGNVDSYSYGGKYFRATTGSLSASFDLPVGVDLIPPGSYVNKNLQALVQPSAVYTDRFMDNTKPEKMTDFSGASYSYRRYSFDRGSSPLQFKSYLAFVLGDGEKEFYVSHSFYAQEILLSSEVPEFFGFYKPEGDKLFVKHSGQ